MQPSKPFSAEIFVSERATEVYIEAIDPDDPDDPPNIKGVVSYATYSGGQTGPFPVKTGGFPSSRLSAGTLPKGYMPRRPIALWWTIPCRACALSGTGNVSLPIGEWPKLPVTPRKN